MADNKLSWTELRRALSQRAGVSEKEANQFLNALNEQLVEALKSDKQVKINGLGNFKLQAVAPRKSVDVTTGEEITIAGYNKVAFVPEAGVKELIESAPVFAAGSETTSVAGSEIDPIQKLGAQADEIVGILGELGQSPEGEGVQEGVQNTEEGVQNTEYRIQTDSETEEPVVVPEPESAVIPEPEPEPEPVIEKEPEPVYIPQPGVPSFVREPEPVEPRKPKEKKYHFWRDTLICVVILLLLLFLGYFFLREQLSGWVEGLLKGKEPIEQVEQVEDPAVVADTVATEPTQTEAIEEDYPPTPERILEEYMEASGSDDEWTEDTKSVYPRLITTERIREGSRLSWISKRYYGSKTYWPYLYDANKDHISNPNDIDVGTPIRIPKLSKTQLDTTNALTRANLERLRMEAERAMR